MYKSTYMHGLVAGARLFSLALTPLAAAAPDDQSGMPQSAAADTDSVPPPGLTPLDPLTDSSTASALTEPEINSIAEEGGYDVTPSTLSDLLLVAEGDPIPIDERTWGPEEQDAYLRDLSVVLVDIVSTYPENLAGTAFSSDDQFLEVYAKDPQGPGISDIAELVETQGLAGKVVIVPVDYSMTELEAAEAALTEEWGEAVSTGIDVVSNAINVAPASPEIQEELPTTEEDATDLLNQFVPQDVVDEFGTEVPEADLSQVPIEIEPYVKEEAAGRYDDTSPFVMGGKTTVDGATCSLGIPIVYAGKYMVLTAGHCTGSKFFSGSGKLVGTQYTSRYPNYVGTYGGWKLVSGDHYLLRIWTAAAKSNSMSLVPIDAANWTYMTVGSQLCTSGQTTGQICQFRVKTAKTSRDVDGRNTGMLTSMTHQSKSGTNDKNGFRKGDSGGPVYYKNSKGKYVVVGIVTSASSDDLTYSYTRLEGVKKWNSSVSLG